jgi:hypothetical protein
MFYNFWMIHRNRQSCTTVKTKGLNQVVSFTTLLHEFHFISNGHSIIAINYEHISMEVMNP